MSWEYYKLKCWLSVLRDIAKIYPCQSIGNVIQQIAARVKTIEEYENKKQNE